MFHCLILAMKRIKNSGRGFEISSSKIHKYVLVIRILQYFSYYKKSLEFTILSLTIDAKYD